MGDTEAQFSPARTRNQAAMLSVFLLILTASSVCSRPVSEHSSDHTILFNIHDTPAQRSAAIQSLLQHNSDLGPDLVQTLTSLTPAGTSGITGTSMDSWRILERLAQLAGRRRRRRRMEKFLQRTSPA